MFEQSNLNTKNRKVQGLFRILFLMMILLVVLGMFLDWVGILFVRGNRSSIQLDCSYSEGRLEPPATSRVDYWDEAQPGFGLRLTSNGKRTWQIMYRSGGVRRRLALPEQGM